MAKLSVDVNIVGLTEELIEGLRPHVVELMERNIDINDADAGVEGLSVQRAATVAVDVLRVISGLEGSAHE